MFNSMMKVKRPDKTKIQRRNGIKYVYFVKEKTYIKEKQYVEEKRVLIGKMLDEEYMNPNTSFFDFYPDFEVELLGKGFNKANSVHVGANTTFRKISDEIGLTSLLKSHFADDEDGKNYVDKILDLASYYLIKQSNVAQNYDLFWKEHCLSNSEMKDDSAISKFLKTLKVLNKAQLFYKEWIKKNKKDERIFVSYDSTNVPNYGVGEGIELAEYGKAKIHDEAPQINIAYAMNQKSGTPLMSEIYQGSINDVEHFQYLIKKMKDYEISGVNFILDRGYFSKKNINEIYKIASGFLMAVKVTNSAVKKEILDNIGNIENPSNYVKGENVYGITRFKKMFKDDLNGEEKYFHIFYDPVRNCSEKETLLSNLHTFLDNLKEEKEKIEDTKNTKLASYITKTACENGEIIFKINDEKVNEETELYGYFCLISSMELTAREALEIYEKRDVIEKLFNGVKNFLGGDNFRVHSDTSIATKSFITFVSAIIRSEIYRRCKSLREKNNKDYTIPQIIAHLDAICCTKGASENYDFFDGITSRQKKLLSALDVSLNDLIKATKYLD